MPSSYQVACVGELLIDFVCSDINSDLSQGEYFIKKAGGAPANVACAIARLGGQAKLAAKVGNDPFGQFLIQTVKQEKVNIDSVIVSDELPTTLAFVALKSDGERDFHFNWGAHDALTYGELNVDFVSSSRILHLGAALTNGNIIDLYRQLIIEAKKHNTIVSFDPNYRQALWTEKDIGIFVKFCHEFIPSADIIKLSEEEASIITGESQPQKATEILHNMGANLVLITLGSKGTLLGYQNRIEVISSIQVQSIDSTGAGDAFIGAVLQQISNQITLPDNFNDMVKIIEFANRVGALTCTKMGAIQAIPYLKEL